jgi:hypothetical protein
LVIPDEMTPSSTSGSPAFTVHAPGHLTKSVIFQNERQNPFIFYTGSSLNFMSLEVMMKIALATKDELLPTWKNIVRVSGNKLLVVGKISLYV